MTRFCSAFLVSLFLLCGTTFPIFGADAKPVPLGKLSVEDCVKIALERSPTVAVAKAQTLQSRGALNAAMSGVLPRVSASVGYTTTTNAIERYSFSSGRFTKTSSIYGAGSQARLSLLDRATWTRVGAAREEARASRESQASSEADVAFQVRSKYYDLVRARKLLEVAREALRLSLDQLRRSESLYSLGSVTKGDVLKAKVSVAESELGVIGAENRAQLEIVRLAALMGLLPDQSFEVDETLEESPVSIDSSAVFSAAMKERPDLKEARHRLKASNLNLGTAGAGRLPSLSLTAGYSSYVSGMPHGFNQFVFGNTKDATTGVDLKNYSWDVGLEVSIPIFDGLLTRGNTQQARAQHVAAKESLRQLELNAQLEVKEAILALKEAREKLVSSKEGLLSAEESYKLSKEKYDVGSGTMLELIDSEVGLARARSSYVDALSSVKVAQAMIVRASGRKY
ncbi:MAG: TolC family protein [Candidatus Eisenbacteria bacterium]|nr:TolC family protein [Candidatus Eisenbacteria bacterium]